MRSRLAGLLALVMIGALLLGGCGGEQGLTAEEVVDKVMESYESLESYEFVMDATQDLEFQDPESGETVAMHNTITGAGKLDMAAERLYMSMTTTVESADIPGEEEFEMPSFDTEMYFVENKVYMYMSIMDMWAQSEIPEALTEQMWAQGDRMKEQMELLEKAEVTLLKDEVVAGRPCYVLDAQVSAELMQEMLMDQLTELMFDQGGLLAAGLENLEFNIYSVRYWVDKDDFMVHRINTVMDVNIGIQGPEEAVASARIMMDMNMELSGFNEPMEIELPEEALNAPDMTEMGTITE
ncbi:MAG TPA: hypothetical protein GXZ96_07750 [Firmicutes bacterium]|nr:hypothetical protein [Bacillota bacterium]